MLAVAVHSVIVGTILTLFIRGKHGTKERSFKLMNQQNQKHLAVAQLAHHRAKHQLTLRLNPSQAKRVLQQTPKSSSELKGTAFTSSPLPLELAIVARKLQLPPSHNG